MSAKAETATSGNWASRIVGHAEVAPADLTPHPLNWREHPQGQRAAVEGSIGEVGWIRSVLVNKRTGRMLDGHLRLALALERGEATVPVEFVDVTEDEERLILATLDPMAGMATRNAERFAELVEALEVRSGPLKDLIASIAPKGGKAGKVNPDKLPDRVEERAKRGDLWLLGRHRIVCGDATSAQDVGTLLAGARPLLMVTDPPYGVDYDPEWREEAGLHPARTGKVTNDDRVDWTPAWALFPGDVAYVWHAGRFASEVQRSIEAAGFEIRNQIIWSKPHFPIGRGHYHWRHEPCWFAARGGHPSYWLGRHEPCWYAVREDRTAHWVGDHKQTTIWEITLDANVAGGHSTQKPAECMARPIWNHEGDVYDPFLGSGTTLIAAEQLSRRCYALEIEPKYVDVALARWEVFTGEKAQRG